MKPSNFVHMIASLRIPVEYEDLSDLLTVDNMVSKTMSMSLFTAKQRPTFRPSWCVRNASIQGNLTCHCT